MWQQLGYGLGTARMGEKADDIIDFTVKAVKAGFTHLDGAEGEFITLPARAADACGRGEPLAHDS